MSRWKWEWIPGVLGMVLLGIGQYLGLVWAPRDAHMGDVARILYVHVPAAWISLVAYTIAFVGGAGALFASEESKPVSRGGWDALAEAAVEVGVVLNLLLLVLGSLFARPTWGVWWDWDPRLTASAVMALTFVGVMLLRGVLEEPERRATWSSAATVLAFVNIPITYMSVRWWRSLHQVQSAPSTLAPEMTLVLRLNAIALLLLAMWMIATRWRIARAEAALREPPPLPEEARG